MKLDIPFAYKLNEAPKSKRRTRGGEGFRRSSVTMDVPETKRSDLFLAFACKGTSKRNFAPFEVDYRVYDGRLVRPVLSAEGKPMTATAFVERTSEAKLSFDNGLMFWSENPFMTSPRSWRDWVNASVAPTETAEDRRRHDGQRSNRLIDLADALKGCVVADGILYRPTIEPVFAVKLINGWVNAELSIDADVFRPDLTFKIDTDDFAGFVEAYWRLSGGESISVVKQPEFPDIVRFDHLRLSANSLLVAGMFQSVVRNVNEFADRLRGASKEAYSKVVAAADDIERDVWSGDNLDRHLDAFEQIVDVVDSVDLEGLSKAALKRLRDVRRLPLIAAAATLAMDLGEDMQRRPSMTR